MKTTSAVQTQKSPYMPTLSNIYKWLGLILLAFMGPIHYFWGPQIVQSPTLLFLFLTTLGLSSCFALNGRYSKPLMFAFIIMIRLCWVINTPSFSDDHFRYLHEGQASLQDLKIPYQKTPLSLAEMPQYPWAKHVNHPHVSAAYLPGLQWFFRLPAYCASLGLSAMGTLRGLLIAFDIGILCFLFFVFRKSNDKTFEPLKWYAFHPLPLLEVYGNSHADIIGAFFILLVVYKTKNSFIKNALYVAISAHIKPFILLFSFWIDKKRPFLFASTTAALFGLLMLPHLFKGIPLWKGFHTYVENWDAFGLLFKFFSTLFVFIGLNDAGFISRLFCGLCFLGAIVFIHMKKQWTLSKQILWGTTCFWICSPTIHPWYLLWLLPWICIERQAFLWLASILWLGHYAVLPSFHAGFGWHEPWWPRLAILILGLSFWYWKRWPSEAFLSEYDSNNLSEENTHNKKSQSPSKQ